MDVEVSIVTFGLLGCSLTHIISPIYIALSKPNNVLGVIEVTFLFLLFFILCVVVVITHLIASQKASSDLEIIILCYQFDKEDRTYICKVGIRKAEKIYIYEISPIYVCI